MSETIHELVGKLVPLWAVFIAIILPWLIWQTYGQWRDDEQRNHIVTSETLQQELVEMKVMMGKIVTTLEIMQRNEIETANRN